MWVATTDFPAAANHPFYNGLNQLLREHGFEASPSPNAPDVTPTRWAGQACHPASTSGCC